MSNLSWIHRIIAQWRATAGLRRLQSYRGDAIREIRVLPHHVQRDLLTLGHKRIHHHNEYVASQTFH